jgi:hypothetical protein
MNSIVMKGIRSREGFFFPMISKTCVAFRRFRNEECEHPAFQRGSGFGTVMGVAGVEARQVGRYNVCFVKGTCRGQANPLCLSLQCTWGSWLSHPKFLPRRLSIVSDLW